MQQRSNEALNRLSVTEYKQEKKYPVYLVLDNIRSLQNVGSVFRSADAFRIAEMYLCGITACPPHRDIQKTALGATESVHWNYKKSTVDAILALRDLGVDCYAVEQTDNSILLDQFSWNKNTPIGLVLGHEVHGVSQEVLSLCKGAIEIPQFGTKHSLNVSVAAGIVLWQLHLLKRRE